MSVRSQVTDSNRELNALIKLIVRQDRGLDLWFVDLVVQVQLCHDNHLEALLDVVDAVSSILLESFKLLFDLLSIDVVELADLV